MNLNQDVVPSNLEEAIKLLQEALDPKEISVIKKMTSTSLHMSIGQYIRNEWSLWDKDTKLVAWFYEKYKVNHADDISAIIIESMVADLNNKPRRDKELAKEFIEHWEAHKKKINTKDKED